jgi:hypothetical protein
MSYDYLNNKFILITLESLYIIIINLIDAEIHVNFLRTAHVVSISSFTF